MPNKVVRHWLWLVALLLDAACAAERIEEIVVTPHRIPVPLSRVATSVSVINQQDIQSHGNLALTDVLRQLPGVAASRNGGIGQPTSLRIRGEEGFRTLALLDGMRLGDPGNTQITPQFEQLLASGIERVEVLRGPQGLSYGADAGGVINVLTRRATPGLLTEIDAQKGGFGTRQLSALAAGSNGAADFFMNAANLNTDGFNVQSADAVVPDKDGYDNTILHARIGFNLNSRWRVEMAQRSVESESGFDGCYLADFTLVHDCAATFDQDIRRFALDYHGDSVTQSLSHAVTITTRDSLARGSSAFLFEGELERTEYLVTMNALPGFNVIAGADSESVRTAEHERGNQGYFAELLSDFSSRWFISAGLRYDDNDDFGTNTSYRVSALRVFELPGVGSVKLKASQGTGLRAPSPYEIAYNRGPWASAPAALTSLQQERSEGVEAGVEFVGVNGLQLEAVVFNQYVDNAIDFDLADFSGYLQYAGRGHSRGVELMAGMPITAELKLQANYTYNTAQRPDGQRRLRRPRQLGNVSVQWQAYSKLSMQAFARLSRDSLDQIGNTWVMLDDFVVVDIGATYQLSDSLQLYGRVENALDVFYQEVNGYNAAMRAAYVGFRLTL